MSDLSQEQSSQSNFQNAEMDIDQELKEDEDDLFNDQEEELPNSTIPSQTSSSQANGNSTTTTSNINPPLIPDLPELSRKDKTLDEILEMMDEYAPIIPDAVTDYYLAKNGFECSDLRIKRVLALATQKFISDIATDAYEYSRIRSSSSVYNSSNPQVRARQLMVGQQSGAAASSGGGSGSGGGASNNQGKIVLTMDDLSSALAEYGLNINRPDFYR